MEANKSMIANDIQLLPSARSRQMRELAERAKTSLTRFASAEVAYNVIGIQLLDEWIDRHLRQFPKPSPNVLTVWGAFLGETFRQRFEGEWAVDKSQSRPRLGIVSPRGNHDFLFVDIMDQIERRVEAGISESLALYYTTKAVEIKEA